MSEKTIIDHEDGGTTTVTSTREKGGRQTHQVDIHDENGHRTGGGSASDESHKDIVKEYKDTHKGDKERQKKRDDDDTKIGGSRNGKAANPDINDDYSGVGKDDSNPIKDKPDPIEPDVTQLGRQSGIGKK